MNVVDMIPKKVKGTRRRMVNDYYDDGHHRHHPHHHIHHQIVAVYKYNHTVDNTAHKNKNILVTCFQPPCT
jgi:hypothetical protein